MSENKIKAAVGDYLCRPWESWRTNQVLPKDVEPTFVLKRVERVTDKTAFLEGGDRVRLSDGASIGQVWRMFWRDALPEQVEKAKVEDARYSEWLRLANLISGIDRRLRKMSLDHLRAIDAIDSQYRERGK